MSQPAARRGSQLRAAAAALVVPPLAVVAASTGPAALLLTQPDGVDWISKLLAAAFLGTAVGGFLVGGPFWIAYAIAAVLVAAGRVTRRATAVSFALAAGGVGLAFTSLLLADTEATAEAAWRIVVAGLWCATVGWVAVLAPPRGLEPATAVASRPPRGGA